MEIQFLKKKGEDLIVHLQHTEHQMDRINTLVLIRECILLCLLNGLLNLGRIFF